MNQGELTLPAARASGLGFAGRVRRSGLIAPALIFAIVVTQAPFALDLVQPAEVEPAPPREQQVQRDPEPHRSVPGR